MNGKPGPQKETGQLREVVAVHAYGHELAYLLKIFSGLPCMSTNHPRFGRSVTWRGDLARFIFDNL